MCVHKTKVVKEDGVSFMHMYPNMKLDSGIVDCNFILNNFDSYMFHTSSYFVTKQSLELFYNTPFVYKKEGQKIGVMDVPIMFYYSYCKKIYYINECMSVYRKFSESSWTKRNTKSDEIYINTAKGFISIMEDIDEVSNFKYHNACQRVIDFYKFVIYYRKSEYKELTKKEYRDILLKFPLYKRIMIYVGCIFPNITNIAKEVHYKYKGTKRNLE